MVEVVRGRRVVRVEVVMVEVARVRRELQLLSLRLVLGGRERCGVCICVCVYLCVCGAR